jgi:hypothetical protein
MRKIKTTTLQEWPIVITGNCRFSGLDLARTREPGLKDWKPSSRIDDAKLYFTQGVSELNSSLSMPRGGSTGSMKP